MNAQQFHNAIKNAEKRPTLQQAESDVKQAIHNYQPSACYRPRRLVVNVSDLGVQKIVNCRCGKCDQCRDYRRSEWVTRMWHETIYGHKNAYMVSLHYKGYPIYGAIPEKLRNAYYRFDNLNSTHSYGFHPCLLRIEHLQMFIRNLRRICCIKCKYYAAGEYGESFGRPHFHVLIWTDDVITSDMIRMCWAVNTAGRKCPYYEQIGNFDFQNLNENGTIVKNDGVYIDGKKYSAKNCFKYLCKYINKTEKVNFDRVELFRKDLINNFYTYNDEEYESVFSNFKELLARYYPLANLDKVDNFTLKRLWFDYVFNLASDGKSSFCVLFKCFTTCSRSEGIGSVYLKYNLERMVKGDFRIEKAPFGGLICPHFYLRKVKDAINPYLRHSQSAGTISFSAQNRPHQVETLRSILNQPFENISDKSLVCNIDPFSCTKQQLSKLLNGSFAWRNATSGERFVLYKSQTLAGEFGDVRAVSFRYNAHERCYEFSHETSLLDFFEKYQACCARSAEITSELFDKIDNDLSLLDASYDVIDSIFDCDEMFCGSLYSVCDSRENNCISAHELLFTQEVERLQEESKQIIKAKFDLYNPKID